MPLEKTLSIIKPDATGKNVIGKIIDRFESNGLGCGDVDLDLWLCIIAPSWHCSMCIWIASEERYLNFCSQRGHLLMASPL